MANLELCIPHQLEEEVALQRIRHMLEELKHDHQDIIKGGEETWEGKSGAFNFIAKGLKFSGKIRVRPQQVLIYAYVPFAVSLFRLNITEFITENARALLS